MTLPTLVAGPGTSVTADPSTVSEDFALPAGSYLPADVLIAAAAGITLTAGVTRGALLVDTSGPWATTGGGGAVLPLATRPHAGDSGALQVIGDQMAGAGHILAFRNTSASLSDQLGGFIETNISAGSSHTITVGALVAETTTVDIAVYLMIGAYRQTPFPDNLPALAPDVTFGGITSSSVGTWTEVASAVGTLNKLYELDGGLPAGTVLDGSTDFATFDAGRGPYTGSTLIDAAVIFARYVAPPGPGWYVGHPMA